MNADEAYRLLHKEVSKENVLHCLNATIETMMLNLHIKNNFSYTMVLDHCIRSSMKESDIIFFVQAKLEPYQGDEAKYACHVYYYCGRQWLSVYLCKKDVGKMKKQHRLKNADVAYSEVMVTRGRTTGELNKALRDLMLTLFASLNVENKFTNTKEVPPEIQLHMSKEALRTEINEFLKSKAGSVAKYVGELLDDGMHALMVKITLVSIS